MRVKIAKANPQTPEYRSQDTSRIVCEKLFHLAIEGVKICITLDLQGLVKI